MEETVDLIRFNNNSSILRELNSFREKDSKSPGNNPFDTLSNMCNSNMSTDILENAFREGSTFQFSEAFMECIDAGKESLGILKMDPADFDCGRESLGILQLKEAGLTPIPELYVHACLENETIDHPKQNSEMHLHPLFTYKEGETDLPTYRSFLKSLDVRSSASSSEPSKIYSLRTSDYTADSYPTSNLFNVAITSAEIDKQLQQSGSPVTTLNIKRGVSDGGLEEFRRRMRQEVSYSDFHLRAASTATTQLEKVMAGVKPSSDTFVVHQNSSNPCDDLDDSVFIEAEAHHLAQKIADGSILEELSDVNNILDCTPQPNFDELEEVENNAKCDTQTVFKMIDKMIPKSPDKNELVSDKKKRSSASSHSSSEANRTNVKEVIENLSAILNSEVRNEQQKSEGQMLLSSLANIICTDNKEVLDDSGRSSIDADVPQTNTEEVIECFEVLDLRTKSNSNSSDDQEKALDLSTNATKPKLVTRSFSFENKHRPPFVRKLQQPPFRSSTSNLEMAAGGNRSLQNNVIRRASESLKERFSYLRSSSSNLESSARSGSSNESKNLSGGGLFKGPILGKLKLKKVNGKTAITKPGPLKAVVNLDKTGADKSAEKLKPPAAGSPANTDETTKNKRTSTPINKSKLKPIAQSTPDSQRPRLNRSSSIPCTSEIKRGKFECPVSPLSRPDSFELLCQSVGTNSSGSAPNLSQNSSIASPKMSRRSSTNDLKKLSQMPLRRSYSTGKNVGLANSASAANIRSSVKASFRSSVNYSDRNNKSDSQAMGKKLSENVVNRSLQKGRSTNLLSKIKRGMGKENAGH